MPEMPVTARIAVCKAGYQWVTLDEWRGSAVAKEMRREGDRKGDLSLIPIAEEPTADHMYDPFVEFPALFYKLAELEPSHDAIRDFANRYGDMYSFLPTGTPFELWRNEISAMHDAVRLWQSLEDGEADKSMQHELDGMISRRGLSFGRLRPVRLPGGALVLELQERSLHEVLWLQFALAVAHSKKYRKCGWCRTPFEVSPDRPGGKRRGRSDRLFCTDSCRVKSYLHRRETAARMRAEGAKLRDIVREVGTDMQTVKKWLG